MSLPHEGPGVHARAPDLELTPAEFFRLLWHGADDPVDPLGGHVCIWTLPDKRSRWFMASEMDRAAAAAEQLAERKDVYFATALIDLEARKRQAAVENQGEVDTKTIRGTSATASALF